MFCFFLFDLDGTLVHNQKLNYDAYQKAYREFGISISFEQFNNCLGKGFEELITSISPAFSQKEKKRLKKLKAKFYCDNISKIIPNTHMIQLVRTLSHSYKIALVTTASKKNALAALKYLNIDSCFSVKVFGEDVQYYKPNPQCYQIALKKLKASPDQCLAFEDSPFGIEAAKAAAIKVIEI